MERQWGTVIWFNDAKGFGMIKPDSGGKDVFVHFSEIRPRGFKTLTPGQRIEFDLVQDPKKGRYAMNVNPF